MSAPLASGQRTISSFFLSAKGAGVAAKSDTAMKRPASAIAAAAAAAEEGGKRRAVSFELID